MYENSLKVHISELINLGDKMSKICSKCGFSNNEDANFCVECGNILESGTVQEGISCPSCNMINPPNSEFCKECGSLLSSETINNNDINQESGSVSSQQSFSSSSNEISCPYCGRLVSETAVKCRYCGEWIKRGQSQVYNQGKDDESHTVAIVLGYIFTFLGGIIGLIIAIYLLTRDNKSAKTHGMIQMVILAIWVVILIAAQV